MKSFRNLSENSAPIDRYSFSYFTDTELCDETWPLTLLNSHGYGCDLYINLLKPTGHVMHQQFNIQQLYALPTLCLCVLYLSENKQRLVLLTA